MSAEDLSNKRTLWYKRKFIVNPEVQYVFVTYAISMGFLFLAVGSVLTSVLQRVALLQVGGWESFGVVDVSLLSMLVLLFAVGLYMGFVVSNRVVGPIFRLVTHMDNIAKGGKIEMLNFRKNDQFKEVAESYNKILTKLKNLEAKDRP